MSQDQGIQKQALQYKTYLFDWDGNIAQTIEVWLDALEAVIPEFGGKPDRDFLKRTFGDWQAPIQCGVPKEREAEFQKALALYASKQLADVKLYPFAADFIAKLKAEGKQLALITSSKREAMEIVLHKYVLSEQFDVIVTAHDVKAHKPDPEGLLFAMRQLRADPATTLMLGDSEKDLGAAVNAKVDSLLFYPPSHQQIYDLGHLKTFRPAFIIDSWKQVI